jgi:serine/threonine-protein kinase
MGHVMTDDPRLQRLIDELLESRCTPEEVCSSCPELLPEVRQRLRQMNRVQAELDALFPPLREQSTTPSGLPLVDPALPRIPGYEVEAVLGHGGMGVVFRARHTRLNRIVALKMLLAGAYAGQHERARFQAEAEAVAGLRHANIVQVYDVADHEGRPYFTMELVDGGSLAQKLAGTPEPARQAAALLATLARAVHVAHQGGIVHRDLKPANILLTADGTPKIADFGLARHFRGGPALTLSGARIGTPSYMAPEQAIGKAGTIGPAADVYSLGAILYELLTGRPPFRGETAAETERQVIAEEPVPPSRLNAKVPRDLETICLKCLHKAPERRYASAAALAEDLERFGRGEPIAARPVGLLERTGKLVRRHPGGSAMLAASLVSVLLLLGAGLWLVVQRAHLRDAVEADLKELAGLQESARWQDAQAVLERTEALLGGGGPGDLRGRLRHARRNLDLVIRLDAIRLRRVTSGELAFYQTRADGEYEAAFHDAGLASVHDDPVRVAGVVEASAVHGALVAALEDWAVCCKDGKRRDWLLEVARQAAPDPDGWRRRVLDPAAWDDRAALTELARTVPLDQPVSLLLALGQRLRATRGDSAPFFKRVQQEHPAAFWANLILGDAMLQWAPKEAVGYYRAALASRPRAAVGYCAVGDALRFQKQLGAAISYYNKALELDSKYARTHNNLGLALQAQDKLDEAIDCHQKALQLDPDYAWAHFDLGKALCEKGRLDEAYEQHQQVIRIDPTNRDVQTSLRILLMRQGRGQEAQATWKKILEGHPPQPDTWFGYPELCLFLGQQEEYRRVRGALLSRFGATTSPKIAEHIGRACLLLPGTPDELRKGAALIARAVAAKGSTPGWIYRYYLFARGLAEYRQGRLDSAIRTLQGEASRVMGPVPRLLLAMAQHGKGKHKQARKTLATAVVGFDWHATQADSQDSWICHILRREAEALILPGLPAFFRGEHQPLDNDERLALVGVCQFQGRYHTAARLYADAFAADPKLVDTLTADCRSRAALGDKQPVGRLEELATECRYPAARCAALAGCGRGADGAKLSEAERTRWRRQARDWMRADLAMWARTLNGGSRAARSLIRKMLLHWQADPALAGLREGNALKTLSDEEGKEWTALWQEVDGLLHRTTGR